MPKKSDEFITSLLDAMHFTGERYWETARYVKIDSADEEWLTLELKSFDVPCINISILKEQLDGMDD